MTHNLIYLDDDPKASGIADGFNTSGLIVVKAERPTSFEEQVKELVINQDNFQGLILDLRLDQDLSGERKAYYSATSLAQQIRSKSIEGGFRNEFPIILFTTQENIATYYSGDISSHDLFDLWITKDRVTEKRVQEMIHALIEAYQKARSFKNDLSKILQLDSLESLDKRIYSNAELSDSNSIFVKVRYVLHDIINTPGVLINENYLAARLGINKAASPEWTKLIDMIKGVKYSGIMSEVFNRWWMFKLNDWWETKIHEEPLASLDARKRVEFLKEKTGLQGLQVAKPITKCTSYRFWTICQGYEQPLDPREGFRIVEKDPLPWQESKYVSLEALLERVKRVDGLRVHPLERERFMDIKKNLTK